MKVFACTVGGTVTDPHVGYEWRDDRFDRHGFFAAARVDSYRGGEPYTMGLCPVPKRPLSAIDGADHLAAICADIKRRWPLRRSTGVVMLDLEAVMYRPYPGQEEDRALGLDHLWIESYLSAFELTRPGLAVFVYNAAPENQSLYVRTPCSPPGLDEVGVLSYRQRVDQVAQVAGSSETVNVWLKYHEHSGRHPEWLDDHEVEAIFDGIESLPPRLADGSRPRDAKGRPIPCRPRAILAWHNVIDREDNAALRKYSERVWWPRIARLRETAVPLGDPAVVAPDASVSA